MLMRDEVITTRTMYNIRESWNTTYNKMNRDCVDNGNTISLGLAKRLAHYARNEIAAGGFQTALEGCEVHVECTDYLGDKPSDNYFTVSFYGFNGYRMGVQGIGLNRGGWPNQDHGLFMDRQ